MTAAAPEQLSDGGARASDELPLAGDTGATSPSWAIDWLAVTVWGVDLDRVCRLVSEAFHLGRPIGSSGWTAMGGARFYACRHEYLGATVLSGCQAKGVEENVHVVLPGEACGVGVDALLQLIGRLRMWSTRCEVGRLDLAVDGVPFTPQDAYRAVREGHTVSWVKRGRDGAVSHTWTASNGAGEGNTLYVGRRSSQRCLRIYSKRGPTRIELETKREYADAVAGKLAELRGDEAGQARFVVGCLREFCDFGTQDGVHGARELRLLPWWQAFVTAAERIGKLNVDRRQALSVDRTLKWVDRAVVPSLAMVVACYGESGKGLLDGWIDSALPHLSPKHVAAIREFMYAYRKGWYAMPTEEVA